MRRRAVLLTFLFQADNTVVVGIKKKKKIEYLFDGIIEERRKSKKRCQTISMRREGI